MERIWLHGRAVTPETVVEQALVEVAGARVTAVWDLRREQGPAAFRAARDAGRLPAGGGRVSLPDGTQAAYYPAGDGYICPGFIDLHVHGGGGAEFMDGTVDAVETVCRFHAAHGTTALLATTWTAPPGAILDTLRTVRAADRCWAGSGEPPDRCAGAQVLGFHVEGPFINPAYKGAQNPDQMRLPDAGEAAAWLDAGGTAGPVWLVTLAPELPGAPELTRWLAARGVRVNAGHTGCTFAELAAGVAAGVSGITHTFNAMRPLHHREPGCAGGAMTLPGLTCELIADGLHVHPAVMQLLLRVRDPEQVVLVTDAVRAAGLPDGEYELGGSRVRVAAGSVRLADGALAGSLLTMDRAVGNLVEQVGLPVRTAVAMASRHPARRMGLDQRKGGLGPGMDADITVLDAQWRTRLTLVGGRVVWSA